MGMTSSNLWYRSLRRLCPHCGQGDIFETWGVIRSQCHACGYPLKKREPDTWFFMYMSTAAITGIFIILLILTASEGSWFVRLVLCVAALMTFVISLPIRKSMAISLDYLANAFGES